MLTAIGRASVQRVLVRGSALAGRRTTSAAPTFVKVFAPVSRTFTTSLWFRSPGATDKPAAKTKKATTTKKTAAKPKAVAKKPAAKKKAVAKPTPTPKAKKELTPEQKLKKEAEELKKDIKELRITALLSEPKKLPDTAWLVFTTANVAGGSSISTQMQAISREFRSLNSTQLQEYTDTAARNRVANDAAYKAWVESHSPLEIYNANLARRQLRRKTEGRVTRSAIRDERLPKGQQLAFGLYSKSRWASGELQGKVTEVSKQLAEEYKNLDPVEKKAYEDLAAADQVRYAKERQSILGKEVKRSASASP